MTSDMPGFLAGVFIGAVTARFGIAAGLMVLVVVTGVAIIVGAFTPVSEDNTRGR